MRETYTEFAILGRSFSCHLHKPVVMLLILEVCPSSCTQLRACSDRVQYNRLSLWGLAHSRCSMNVSWRNGCKIIWLYVGIIEFFPPTLFNWGKWAHWGHFAKSPGCHAKEFRALYYMSQWFPNLSEFSKVVHYINRIPTLPCHALI